MLPVRCIIACCIKVSSFWTLLLSQKVQLLEITRTIYLLQLNWRTRNFFARNSRKMQNQTKISLTQGWITSLCHLAKRVQHVHDDYCRVWHVVRFNDHIIQGMCTCKCFAFSFIQLCTYQIVNNHRLIQVEAVCRACCHKVQYSPDLCTIVSGPSRRTWEYACAFYVVIAVHL